MANKQNREIERWVHDDTTPWDVYAHGITRVIAETCTTFQEMQIVETGAYGRALVLDGKWQSSEVDEFLYHEPLVHPAMLAHGGPRRVLILGGGEGATAREVLSWSSVERVVMVDIDREVVDACRLHLDCMHRGAFEDPRVELVIDDAFNVLTHEEHRWDVIVSDLTEPIESGPSFKLFTREFYELVRRALSDGGVLAVQAGGVSPYELPLHARLINTIRAVFDHVRPYATFVPTFGTPWGFALASDNPVEERLSPHAIDDALTRHGVSGLRMLDGVAVQGLFGIPRHVRAAIADQTHVYTLTDPPRLKATDAATTPEASTRY